MKRLPLLLFLFVIAFGFVNVTKAETKSLQSLNWYDNLIFKNDSFTFEFIRTLGYAYSKGVDLGESVNTARSIKDGDIHSWYRQWLNLANRIHTVARKMQKKSIVSAREAYFRASNYYRTAGFYMDKVEDRNKSITSYKSSKVNFLKAIASLDYIQEIKIPYEKTTLPGYFIQSSQKNAPLLIVLTGFDGTAEELYFEVAEAAHQRDYNVLLFEGPGQGVVLRQQKLPFRPDWEKVITPVINYAMSLPDPNKNKIALMGISMGGYLAARGCAFDHRIKACILNSGIYDMAEGMNKNLPQNLTTLVNIEPQEFNKIMANEMKKNVMTAWFFNHAMWAFAVKTPADVVQTLTKYTMKDAIKNIKCPTLVVSSEADIFDKGQSKKLFDLLKAPKTLLRFTREEAAQAHCQVGAIAISNEKILIWLNKTFKVAN